MNTKFLHRTRLVLAAALIGAASIALAPAQALPTAEWDNLDDDSDVLVEGVNMVDYLNGKRAPNGLTRSALSQGSVDYLMTVFEWTFELSMTKAERDEFTRRLASVWASGASENRVHGVFGVLQWRSAIDEFSSDLYSDRWGRTLKRNEMTIALRQAARADKENGPWLLSVYDRHNPALAKGEPRLTRLTTNAITDRLVFMINEVIGKPAAKPTADLRKRVAAQAAVVWPKMTRARREEFLKMETDFQYMQQAGWKYQTEEAREEMRIRWGSELVGSFPAVKPMYNLRKNRLAAARRKSAARWAKMSAGQRQIAIMQVQNQAQTNQMMITSMHNMQVQNHVTNMNIIENMRPTPQFHYSVR